MCLGGEHKTKLNYSTYQTKVEAKMNKMKWNYMANMIMSVLGIVCSLILYFPVNQGLAINLPWPAHKNKQRFELFWRLFDIISWSVFWGGGFNVLDQIWRENEQNYMTNMIMNVSGTVFQLIHYFPGKQRLAINLLWPALKSKHTYIEFVDISWSMWILILLAFGAITKYIINKILHSLGTR